MATMARREAVFRGGDGGVLPTHGAVGGPSGLEARANARVCLTCQDGGPTAETADPCDRAHNVRAIDYDGLMRLVPAANRSMVRSSRARRYPPSSMTSRGVAFDSAFDELYELQGRLDGVPGLGRAGNASSAAAATEEAVRLLKSDLRLRDVIEKNAGAWRVPTAAAADADEAEKWLREHDPGYRGGASGEA